MRSILLPILAILASTGWQPSLAGEVGLIVWPQGESELMKHHLQSAQVDFQAIAADDLAAASQVPAHIRVLFLPAAAGYPAPLLERVVAWHQRGGLVITSGPIDLSRQYFRVGQQWLDWPMALLAQGQWKAVDLPLDSLAEKWQGAASHSGLTSLVEQVPGPLPGSSAVEFPFAVSSNAAGWQVWACTTEMQPQDGMLAFWIRGDGGQHACIVEIEEQDGARWQARVPLTNMWNRQVLTKDDFKWWPDNQALGRGGAGDQLKLAEASRFKVVMTSELAIAATHAITLAGLESAPLEMNFKPVSLPAVMGVHPIEQRYLLPKGKYAAALRADGNLPAASTELVFEGLALCAFPASRGLGCHAAGSRRWIPLLELRDDESGELQGFPSWLAVESEGTAVRVWGHIGLIPERRTAGEGLVEPLIRRLVALGLQDLHLVNGGATEFTYFAGETMQVGAAVCNRGATSADIEVLWRFHGAGGEAVAVQSRGHVDAGGCTRLVSELNPAGCELGVGTMEVLLSVNGAEQVLDRIQYPVRIMQPRQGSRFVSTQVDSFMREGVIWRPYGVNYWPWYCVGKQSAEEWLNPWRVGVYDPELIERDLQLMQRMGLNSVSIQYGDRDSSRGLADLLERLGEHDILANIYLPGELPFDENPDSFQAQVALIEAASLATHDGIWAWDIAWEPHVGHQAQRRDWDPQWRVWIERQYGSLEHAEQLWDYACPRHEGQPTGPSDDQLVMRGTWDRFVAAYRRFCSDRVSLAYGRARRAIRQIGAHQLLGARTGWGGTGTEWGARGMQYDLAWGAMHLDFTSPESWGYGPGNMDEFGLMVQYGRSVSYFKPVFMSEGGLSIWPGEAAVKLAEQGEHYRVMLRTASRTGASGVAPWWWPGGFRYGENSDYGIVAGSGTLRPAALVMEASAAAMKVAEPPARPTDFGDINREDLPGGMFQFRQDHREVFLSALATGELFGFIEREAPRSTYYMEGETFGGAIGEPPCPFVWVNAEFDPLQVHAGENWKPVDGDMEIECKEGERIRILARALNTGQTIWGEIPQSGRSSRPGGVFLRLYAGDRMHEEIGLERSVSPTEVVELPSLSYPVNELPIKLMVCMHMDRRGDFGQRAVIVLKRKE